MQNTYLPKFSYIIPFRYRADRIIPLKRVIDWLSGFQGIEVIIVEQDTHSKISHLNLRARHIFIESNLPFNKSWSLNVGLRASLSQRIIFGDADFIMNPNDLIQSLTQLDSCECVIPTSNIIKLAPHESNIDLNSIFTIKRNDFKKSMTEGIVLFKKDSINKIGGWHEDFIGVGMETEAQDIKITKFLNYNQLNFTGYHLFHHSDKNSPEQIERNTQILEQIKIMDVPKLGGFINSTFGKIGHLNKYS